MKLHLPQSLRSALLACCLLGTSAVAADPSLLWTMTFGENINGSGVNYLVKCEDGGSFTTTGVWDVNAPVGADYMVSTVARRAHFQGSSGIGLSWDDDFKIEVEFSLSDNYATSGNMPAIMQLSGSNIQLQFGPAKNDEVFTLGGFNADALTTSLRVKKGDEKQVASLYVIDGEVWLELDGMLVQTGDLGANVSGVIQNLTLGGQSGSNNRIESNIYSVRAYAVDRDWISTYYWEGAGDWSGDVWSTRDGSTSRLGTLPTGKNVVFTGGAAAEVGVDTAATVKNMTIGSGSYVFKTTGGTLEVEDTLAVSAGASADIQLGVKAGRIINQGTLTLTGDIDTRSIEVSGAGAGLTLSDATLHTVIENAGGTVNLSGTITLDSATFRGVEVDEITPETGHGFSEVVNRYTIVRGAGTASAATDIIWKIGSGEYSGASVSFSGGNLEVTSQSTRYYVATDSVYSDGTINGESGATVLALNGGRVRLDSSPKGIRIRATEKGGSLDLNGQRLSQSLFDELGGAVVLSGEAGSTYVLNYEQQLAPNLQLDPMAWKGTVEINGVVGREGTFDVSGLTTDQSTLSCTTVSAGELVSGKTATVACETLNVWTKGDVAGNLAVARALTLGSTGSPDRADSAGTMTVVGTLSSDSLTMGHAGSRLHAGALETSGDTFTLKFADANVFREMNRLSNGTRLEVVTLDVAYDGDAALDARFGGVKYITSLSWNTDKTCLQMSASVNENWVADAVAATSANGEVGMEMLEEVYHTDDVQETAPDTVLARVLDAVELGYVGDTEAAAVAGASVAALGLAVGGDMERQLQAIRNRTTTMGAGPTEMNTTMPYFNAWINAEANHAELDNDGTMSGYKLSSWGGTVGCDVDIAPGFTAGMALTAMYGDYESEGADSLEGDMDTCYLTVFARYTPSAWSHTFVGSVGMMDATLERTVRAGTMSYKAEGETEGVSLGLMYELGYVVPVSEDCSTCLQPVLNVMLSKTTVDGYTETGAGNASLEVDDQEMTTLTFGLGARMQTVAGETVYNRASIFEARVLAKLRTGDLGSKTDVGLIDRDTPAAIESAEMGAFGVELGAGITVPLDEESSLFLDGSVEISNGYSNVNAALGYRLNF